MTDLIHTTTSNPDASTGATTARPKGAVWAHKELEATLKSPTVTRVTEAGGIYGVVKRLKDGSASVWFRWRFRHAGKLADFTCGTWPGDSLKDIREAHAWAVEQHKAGKNPSTERQLSKAQAAHAQAELARTYTEETVRALADRWQQAELVKRGTKGRKDNGTEVLRSFERDIFPTLGDRPLASIKRAEWAELFDEVKARSPRMALRLFADARQFLDWCSRRDYIEVNPLHKLKRDDIAPAYKERDRVLWDSKSPTPHAELLELRDKLPSARLQRTTELALWIMLGTACRVGELSIARWEHVDLANRRWHIPAPKNGVPHDVYLSDFTLRYLEELHSLTGHTAWCFPADNKRDANGNPTSHVCEKSIGKQLRSRQRAVPLKNNSKAVQTLCLTGGAWTAHDIRRTAATIMGACGVSGELVERAINHVPNKLVRTYQKSDRWPELVTAWAKLGAELDRVLHGTDAKVIAFPTKAA